jgi:hypothetical protein
MRGALLAALAAVSTAAAAAEVLDVKTGAWEMTSTGTMTGLKMPADTLAAMPPAQRAELEKQMKALEGKPQTHTTKECLTKEDLDEGQLLKDDEEEGVKCTTRIVSRSSKKVVAERTCPAPAASKSRMVFEAQGREKVTGNFETQRADGARIQVEMKGRWLGASCEGIAK